MMSLKNKYTLPLIAAPLLGLFSCSDDDGFSTVTSDDPSRIYLKLKVSTIEAQGGATRAEDVVDENNGFQTIAYPHEGINQLRVVITRDSLMADGSKRQVVEAKNLFNAPSWADGGSVLSSGEMTFKLKYRSLNDPSSTTEPRRVWLFANSEDILAEYPMPVGEFFPESAITGLQIGRSAGTPLFDNRGAEKKYIPMSEVFDIIIKKPESINDYHQTANEMFVTRAAVKFTFNVQFDADYVDDGSSITSITVDGLADKEFYMPHNTVYSPAKYQDSSNEDGGRFITSYTIPADAVHSSFDFLSGGSIRLKPVKEGITYSPEIYFPESPRATGDTKSFQRISLSINGEQTEVKTFPNLASLPRNTHVVVNLKFSKRGIKWAVTLAPYDEVWLFPIFGLDQDNKNPTEPETPDNPAEP